VRAARIDDPAWTERHYLHNRLRRVGATSDIANAVLFLCSEAAGFVTGHALVVDGGYLLPFPSEGMRLMKGYLREHPDALNEE
jgi:NAD(P)-dependent dehydrogenase (short-subunit alcohol dehydrogenase family)